VWKAKAYVAIGVFHGDIELTGGYEHGRDPYMMIAGAMTMFLHPAILALRPYVHQAPCRSVDCAVLAAL
jgi:hypothetical protein